jgi:hypothetical protein
LTQILNIGPEKAFQKIRQFCAYQERNHHEVKDKLYGYGLYKEQIENKYNWALNLSWNNQANKILNEYILKHTLEYKGMYNWTNDLPQGSRDIFLKIIEYFNINHIDKETKILEIGTYTGISLINIIKLIPNSIGYGLDKWEH